VRRGLPPVEAQAGESRWLWLPQKTSQGESQSRVFRRGQPLTPAVRSHCSSLLPRCPASVAETFCRLRFPADRFIAFPHPLRHKRVVLVRRGRSFHSPAPAFPDVACGWDYGPPGAVCSGDARKEAIAFLTTLRIEADRFCLDGAKG
jgi:hypothetical protein